MAKNKVLVLGAGASKGYCETFFIGKELLNDIYSRVYDEPKGTAYLSNFLPRFEGITGDHQRKFKEDLGIYKEAYSNPSIDHFININRKSKPVYSKIALFSIAFHIMGYEGESKDDNERLIKADDHGTWLYGIAKYIETHGLDSENLKIVTFNYDRLVEKYLLAYFKDMADEVNTFIENNIHHVYGHIGALHKKAPYLEYGAKNNCQEDVEKAANNFMLMYGERTGELNEEIPKIKKVILEADEIYSLGFAFDRLNCCNIGLFQVAPSTRLMLNAFNTEESRRLSNIFEDHDRCISVGRCEKFVARFFG